MTASHRSPALVDLERQALADLFERLGPQAPTLLPGWQAQDLLEHLVVREGSPAAMLQADAGGLVGAWARRRRDRLVAGSFADLVRRFRYGPPRGSLFRLLDSFANTAELLIHHEDLRRAQPGWERRRLPRDQDREVWTLVRRLARFITRMPADLTLVSPWGGHRVGRRPGRRGPAVRVHGDPLELLLWIYGRDDVAAVRISTDAAGQKALQASRRGV